MIRVPRSGARTGLGRSYQLARLALESYVDGCFNEGTEAMRLAIAAEEAHPELAGVIGSVAVDEATHAELAWQTVAWTIAEGGPLIGAMLALVPLPVPEPSALPEGIRPTAVRPWGVVGPERSRSCALAARAATRSRLRHLRRKAHREA